DPALPHLHRDAAALGALPIAGAGAVLLVALGLALASESSAWWHGGWLVAMTGLLLAGWRAAGRAAGLEAPAGPAELPTPLAHGPAGRLAAGGLVAYHLVALLAWQLPVAPGLPSRAEIRRLVTPWVELSFTRHLWSMFGPNGPQANRGVRTTIVDRAGQIHDLRTELQRPENLRRPYLRHDRSRKVDEALGGYRTWIGPWHARYLCRRWAMDHGGEPPAEVRLERVVAPFPPLEPLDASAWFWAHAKVTPLGRMRCAAEPFAQLAPEVRARHGLPPAADGELRYAWPKPKPPDPLEPLWVVLALALGAATLRWSRRSGA
ncbi:MAG: hypothetical protein KDK70_31450, partial [Myxococcales bacterium]|nr:hypothetical protein [Myxococcales bacterium]